MGKVIEFKNVYLKDHYTVTTEEETKGGISPKEVAQFTKKNTTFEKAEIAFQEKVLKELLLTNDKVDAVVGGDLSNQIGITSYSLKGIPIPYIGVYAACATFPLSLLVASSLIDKGCKQVATITSSSTQVAEKTFRYPNEYGAPRYKRATKTATGATGVILARKKTNTKIVNGFIGKVIDYDQKDPNHLGAAMAPAAARTLMEYLEATNKKVEDYDIVLTGDLGRIGSTLFQKILEENQIHIKNHQDAGSILFKNKDCQGASGPAALPIVLLNEVLPNKKYKKILAIGTGALHTPSLMNQKESIPSIAHAIYLEVNHESN